MSSAVFPPAGRTLLGRRFSVAAREGRLELPRCADCGAIQYPPREICRTCLGSNLEWAEIDGGGVVLACCELSNSLEPWFQERLPWTIASTRLDIGLNLLTHVVPAAAQAGTRVLVKNVADTSGEGVLCAIPDDDRDLERGSLDALLKEYRVVS